MATLLAPVPAAFAAPGGPGVGVVRADANKVNAISSAVIGEDELGLADVTVNALDVSGSVVATTATGADGTWSILTSPLVASFLLLTAGAALIVVRRRGKEHARGK
jgi:hypothetical protein